MTILDLIKKSATILNVAEILNDSALENLGISKEQDALANNFTLTRYFELAKLVINEVGSYAPIIKRHIFKTQNNVIDVYGVAGCVKVISVENDNGYVKFDVIEGKIYLKENGSYYVTYASLSQTDYLNDSIDTRTTGVGEEVFINGLNAYYCLAMGLYAEYNVYNAQYVDRLNGIKKLKVFAMPCRSWND